MRDCRPNAVLPNRSGDEHSCLRTLKRDMRVDLVRRKIPDGRRRAHLSGMREGISVEVSAADRARLEAVVADRNSPQKHVWRARIVLATADGAGAGEIGRRTGKSKPCVWRWQARVAAEGG